MTTTAATTSAAAISSSTSNSRQTLSEHACFGGVQGFYQHDSATIGLPMRVAVFVPPQAKAGPVPVLFYLAGLTCTEETFAVKAGAQRLAAELGLMLVCPDTSPRNTGVAGADAAWDFGTGAGFYLDATEAPWATRWRMETYLTQELRAWVFEHFAADPARVGLFGHSMGGHGALTLALRHPGLYQSVSAFAPIAAPTQCPWGVKAFSGYLGEDRSTWATHDATELVKAGAKAPPLLVDQGLADKFLAEQLHPHLFEAACQAAGQPLVLRRHAGYDHGYYFISTFMADHLAHHAGHLAAVAG
jgi:S-formylglutathione hydrolase